MTEIHPCLCSLLQFRLTYLSVCLTVAEQTAILIPPSLLWPVCWSGFMQICTCSVTLQTPSLLLCFCWLCSVSPKIEEGLQTHWARGVQRVHGVVDVGYSLLYLNIKREGISPVVAQSNSVSSPSFSCLNFGPPTRCSKPHPLQWNNSDNMVELLSFRDVLVHRHNISIIWIYYVCFILDHYDAAEQFIQWVQYYHNQYKRQDYSNI